MTTILERVASSAPVTPVWMAHADEVNPRAIEREILERNNMYTYQTPGAQRSDSGDGPRRIAVTITDATFSGRVARGEWREEGVER